MQPEEYTIVVHGECFVLACDQIVFNAPNYFTALFAGTFREAMQSDGTHAVTLMFYRDPRLFKIVQTSLAGYRIPPVADNWMPANMSHDAALKNLREDARFYALRTLVGRLEPAMNGVGVRKAMSLNDEEDQW